MTPMTLLAIAFGIVQAAAEPYAWPLELPRELTSSFGEYRPGRFHAGIDLRTGGVIGKNVYAAADGYVARVRCSPWGYGKAVYLHLEDGMTAVYGHLDDYYPLLRDYVRRAQHRARKYTVDLYPEPGLLPVTRGQLIAKSGQTGIGAPHLHYELRDAAQCPVNPRNHGITWPDTTPPRINGVLVQPRGGDGSVNGDLLPVTLQPRQAAGGGYVTEPVTASGAIAFAVRYVDPASGGRYKLGAWRLRAATDAGEIFRVQCDRFAYADNSDGVVAYHPFFLAEGRYQVLWRWPGNEHGFYEVVKPDGWFSVPGEGVDVTIELTDFQDNTATVTVPVRPGAPPQTATQDSSSSSSSSSSGDGQGTVALECVGPWLVVTTRFSTAAPQAPAGLIEGPGDIHALAWRQVAADTFRATFVPVHTGAHALRVTHPRLAEPYEKTIAVFVRGQGGRIELGEVALTAAADTPYGALFAAVDTRTSGGAGGELDRMGPVYRFWPAGAPIDADLRVTIPLPAGAEANAAQLDAYRKSGGSWSRVRASVSNGRVTFNAGKLGDYALHTDTTPPSITGVVPAGSGAVNSMRPEIRATVRDSGSGVAAWEATCGDQWLLTAYDPDNHRINWERDADLPAGEQTLRIAVTDGAGNTQTVTRKLNVPAQ
ncbi:MAG: M23 family metallopeptidase [Candidatus Hydrogenedentota bacterium]